MKKKDDFSLQICCCSCCCCCCYYCYKLSVQKSVSLSLPLSHSQSFSVCFFSLLIPNLSVYLSVYISVYHNKNVRTTASIYLFVCREYFMSIPCISDCDWCSIENVESVIWFEIGSSILFLVFFASLLSFFLFWNICSFFVDVVVVFGWLANGRQCTHVGLDLIRINGKNMRVYIPVV